MVTLGRILLSEIQFKACLLNLYYVKAQRKSDPPFQGQHRSCCNFTSVLGEPWPFWMCFMLLSNLEWRLSDYVLFVEAHDLIIFESLRSECGVNNDRLFCVPAWSLRGLHPYWVLWCLGLWVAQGISDRAGGGSLFYLRGTVKQWSLDFHQGWLMFPIPPLLSIQESVAFCLLKVWIILYLFLTGLGAQLFILSMNLWCHSVFLEDIAWGANNAVLKPKTGRETLGVKTES